MYRHCLSHLSVITVINWLPCDSVACSA